MARSAGLSLALQPGAAQLSIVTSADETNREQALFVPWDADSQGLVAKKWVVTSRSLTVKVAPLTNSAGLPARP